MFYIVAMKGKIFCQLDKVSASQPRDCGFELHTGHDHGSSYDTSTGCFQE